MRPPPAGVGIGMRPPPAGVGIGMRPPPAHTCMTAHILHSLYHWEWGFLSGFSVSYAQRLPHNALLVIVYLINTLATTKYPTILPWSPLPPSIHIPHSLLSLPPSLLSLPPSLLSLSPSLLPSSFSPSHLTSYKPP